MDSCIYMSKQLFILINNILVCAVKWFSLTNCNISDKNFIFSICCVSFDVAKHVSQLSF